MGAKVLGTLANALDTLINSPRGREILASAVVAAASAAAAALTKSSDHNEVTKARPAAAEAGKQLTQDLSDAAASRGRNRKRCGAFTASRFAYRREQEARKLRFRGAVDAFRGRAYGLPCALFSWPRRACREISSFAFWSLFF
jgi:hypothetical protein